MFKFACLQKLKLMPNIIILLTCNSLSVLLLLHGKNFLNHSIWQTQKFDAMIFLGVIPFYFILVCVIWWGSCHSLCVAFHCNGSVGYVVLSLFTRLHRQISNSNQKCKVMLQIYRPYKPCKTQDCQQQNST